MSPDKNQKDNPIQKEYEDKLNPLKNIEKKGTVAGDKSPGQKNSIADNLGIGGVKDAEQSAGGTGWKNNVVGAGATSGFRANGVTATLKKKSPTMAIIALVVGLMTGVAMFGGAALLPQSLLANLVQKFNSHQETSLTIRTNKLLAVKLADNVTNGSCSYVKIACRFKRPSNKLLAQLEKNGIEALDSSGKKIESKTLYPNKKPVKYRFTNSIGKEIEVGPKEISSTIAKNAEFRDAMHQATKTRFMSLSDYVYKGIKTRFGFNSSDKLKSIPDDEDDLIKKADELSAADGEAAKAAKEGGEGAMKSFARSLLGDFGAEAAEQLGKSTKGDAIGLAAGVVCLAADGPKIIIQANRAFQMTQLIKYSMVFLSTFGAIKAGDATPEESSAILALLTTQYRGKSAMDSFGVSYSLSGSTKPKNDNFKQYAPGSNIIKKLGGVNKILGSRTKNAICGVATNPVTGATINATLAATGPGVVAAFINMAAGFAVGEIVQHAAPPLIEKAVNLLPMEKILNYFFGDLTQDLHGEAVGDALTSGAAHTMGQTANAGGNMPLTVKQAVAYDNLTNQIQLAYAEEDRATKSPLDASSPNTFMGSLISKLTPYYMGTSLKLGSFSPTITSIGSMVAGSFGAILQPVTSSATSSNFGEDNYKLCDDPSISDDNIAAGPYCDIVYGVPNKYLDKDPEIVVDNMVSNNQIDAETGNPVEGSDYETWLELCTDGTTKNANSCMINDDQNAEYAVYTIDHRIQISMDEEEVDSATIDAIAGTTTDSESDTTSENSLMIFGGSIADRMMKPANGNMEEAFTNEGWDVTVNSEPGRNFADALKEAKKPSTTEDIKNANAIVIPLGANNLSDIDEATSSQSGAVFTSKMEEFFDYVHSINPDATYYWVNYGLWGYNLDLFAKTPAKKAEYLSKQKRMQYINKLITSFADKNGIKIINWRDNSSVEDYKPLGGVHPSQASVVIEKGYGMVHYSRFVLKGVGSPQ